MNTTFTDNNEIHTTTSLDVPCPEVVRKLIEEALDELPSVEYGYYADDLAEKLKLPTALVVEVTGQMLEEGLLAVVKP